jgi:hypothetical protein
MAGATRKQVEAALARESAQFDKSHRGVHRFGPIWQANNGSGCNWSSTPHLIGSKLPLDDMRDALERVQARFPVATFD